MPPGEFLILVIVGLIAGALGGLLGIGGSVVMIPVLTLLLNRDQHLAQAAAMIVNIFVTVPALFRHHGARAVDWMVVRRMLPAALLAIIVGVMLSNKLPSDQLKMAFGLFLVYVIVVTVRRFFDGASVEDGERIRRTWTRATTVGVVTGLAAGLLGIGGGIIAVPMLQRMCHLPLRRAIACSAAVMCVTAVVGAVLKNMTLAELPGLDLTITESLLLSTCLAPTAVVGGLLGASLTHALPVKWVRLALVVLMIVACVKLLGIV